MKYSKKEIKDLLIAWLLISLAFAIVFSSGMELSKLYPNFFILFLFSMFSVGIGFLFHELMHKYFAQKYGLFAEFRAFYGMLFLALLFSFLGFVFAAPGAVLIKGKMSKDKEGKISSAGPVTNIVLAIIFLILLLFVTNDSLIKILFSIGFSVNSFLALFNLIPFGLFDGKKVYEWNKLIYFILITLSIILVILSFLIQ